MKIRFLLGLLLWSLTLATTLVAGSHSGKDTGAAPVVQPANADQMRIEGEKRYHANCGRCHAAPQKFPPRMMATVLRHMRVRATITDEDRRLILFYMTQ
jgi:cytochrome c5